MSTTIEEGTPAVDTPDVIAPWVAGSRIALNVRRIRLTDQMLEGLSADNECFRLELTAKSELIIMSPTGMKTEKLNLEIARQLANWTKAEGTGECFGNNGGFKLPNGAVRAPDAAWVRRERWDALTEEQQVTFAPIAPDFVIELRSRSDSRRALEAKMVEWIENGVRLGWLIDPFAKRVDVYEPADNLSGQRVAIHVHDHPESLSGDPLLPGFVLDLREIF